MSPARSQSARRAIGYTERLAEADAGTSAGSRGDFYDNAPAEALNSLFKAACIRNPVMPQQMANRPRRRDRGRSAGVPPSPH